MIDDKWNTSTVMTIDREHMENAERTHGYGDSVVGPPIPLCQSCWRSLLPFINLVDQEVREQSTRP